MTDRKPPQQSFPTWIDQQIAEAERRGVFDNLPGTGKPLPHRRESDFTQAWLRDKLRREGVPTEEMLPTPLRLRREAERLTSGPVSLRSEAEVREAVAELNRRIVDWRRNSTDGPPIPVPLVKEDQAVATWHQARAAQTAQAADTEPPALSPAGHAPPTPRRRWRWPRRRR
jgi:DnaJ-like protein